MFEKPTKTELTRLMLDLCGECESRMQRWNAFAFKMDGLTNDDLTGLGYSADDITYIRSMVTAFKNIYLKYRNQTPLNSDDPSYFIQYMTRMVV